MNKPSGDFEYIKSDIQVVLSGGLGNQLFQICAGLSLENFSNRRVIFNHSNLDVKAKSTRRNYTRNFETSELITDFPCVTSKVPLRVRILAERLKKISITNNFYFESDPFKNILDSELVGYKKVHGYFQNIDAVKIIWDELRTRMLSSARYNSLIDSNAKNRVALHLRFGDYYYDKETRNYHGFTNLEYFKSAITLISELDSGVVNGIIVTDNALLAMEYLSKINSRLKFEIISSNDPVSDLIELATSSHIIMNNSTFSWWAGWIGSNEFGASIIYPTPWLASKNVESIPLFDSTWVALPRRFE